MPGGCASRYKRVVTAADQQIAAGAFGQQMALAADAETPGRYLVDVDPRWNCPIVPQGGMMTALTAAAMAAEIGDPAQRLRTITTVFAAQVPAGPVTVDVSVLRRGRRATQAVATTCAAGADVGHTSVAVFGPDGGGFEFTDLAMPDVPPPEECRSFRDPVPDGIDFEFDEDRPPMPFWDNVEGRPAMGHAPWEDYVPSASDSAFWYRFEEPPTRPDGTLDPLAAIALCDLMPSSVGERMGPGQRDVVSAERRPHGPPVRRAPRRVAAGPPAGPPRQRGLRVDRDGAVGPDRPVARRPRRPGHVPGLPRRPADGRRPHPPRPAPRPATLTQERFPQLFRGS